MTHDKLTTQILNCSGASYWLKQQLVELNKRDISDVLRDLDVLKLVFEKQLDELCDEYTMQLTRN